MTTQEQYEYEKEHAAIREELAQMQKERERHIQEWNAYKASYTIGWHSPGNLDEIIKQQLYADNLFKAAHPDLHSLCGLVQFTLCLFPAFLFVAALCFLIDANRYNYWLLVSIFGCLIIGFAFLNLFGIILKQYIGHLFTIGAFLIGTVLVAFPFI